MKNDLKINVAYSTFKYISRYRNLIERPNKLLIKTLNLEISISWLQNSNYIVIIEVVGEFKNSCIKPENEFRMSCVLDIVLSMEDTQ